MAIFAKYSNSLVLNIPKESPMVFGTEVAPQNRQAPSLNSNNQIFIAPYASYIPSPPLPPVTSPFSPSSLSHLATKGYIRNIVSPIPHTGRQQIDSFSFRRRIAQYKKSAIFLWFLKRFGRLLRHLIQYVINFIVQLSSYLKNQLEIIQKKNLSSYLACSASL